MSPHLSLTQAEPSTTWVGWEPGGVEPWGVEPGGGWSLGWVEPGGWSLGVGVGGAWGGGGGGGLERRVGLGREWAWGEWVAVARCMTVECIISIPTCAK